MLFATLVEIYLTDTGNMWRGNETDKRTKQEICGMEGHGDIMLPFDRAQLDSMEMKVVPTRRLPVRGEQRLPSQSLN